MPVLEDNISKKVQLLFEACRPVASRLLGGAGIGLYDIGDQVKKYSPSRTRNKKGGYLLFKTNIKGIHADFRANRLPLPFSATETLILKELLSTFETLSNRFDIEDFDTLFRTALSNTWTDIAIARFLCGKRQNYWPISHVINQCKNLTFQKYEGAQATTAIFVYDGKIPDNKFWTNKGMSITKISGGSKIDHTFFKNPFSYRFVNGFNTCYLCNGEGRASAIVNLGIDKSFDTIDRISHMTHREVISLFGTGSISNPFLFVIFVNNMGEVEILLPSGLVVLWRKGFWALMDPDILSEFLGSSVNKEFHEDIFWALYSLTRTRHGSILFFDDGEELKKLRPKAVSTGSNTIKAGKKLIKNKNIRDLKADGLLLGVLSSDGMTTIGREGQIVESNSIIHPPKDCELRTDQGGGGRTQAAMAASFFGRVIKVSEDGPISFIRDGKKIYETETFKY